MNDTRTSRTATTRQTNSTASATSTTVSSSSCGCGCHGQGLPSEGCCKLTCFERPQYFCGQLLSDADLTAEETYFREKNKLYHRTLDGFGVVCGLRMTCDGQCKGHITIGDGYAIDCCGNDLVVCRPRSFDVIGKLREKKWLVEVPREHHRSRLEPLEHDDLDFKDRGDNGNHDCISKTCYYIGICYEEEALDFVTPYSTDCTPAPAPCQPTRIREGARFEIYDKLPVRPNPLNEVGKRIECCFRMFRDGQFCRGLQQLAPRILDVLCYDDKTRGRDDNTQSSHDERYQTKEREAHCLFEELRAQFLHELRTCPDLYNCNLEEQVYRLRPPSRGGYTTDPAAPEAFTKLLELIQKHVFSCVLAQFAFQCPEPPDPCCVLIGSVEVENGRLTRVINYPRWYLWSFANFFEVLTYQLANDAACGNKSMKQTSPDQQVDYQKAGKNGCCPSFEVDVCEFLQLFHADNRAFEKAARTSVDAIQAVYDSLSDGFNFMRPHGIAPAVLNNLPFEQAQKLAKELNFSLESLGEPPSEAQDPLSALLANLIHRGTAPIAAFEREKFVIGATRIMNAAARPSSKPDSVSPEDTSALGQQVKQLEDELQRLKESLAKPPGVAQALEQRFKQFEEELGRMKESPTKVAAEVPQAMEERLKQIEEGLRNVEKSLAEKVEHLWRKIFRTEGDTGGND